MKRPKDVGQDFDEYARKWRSENYRMETAYDSVTGLVADPTKQAEVQRAGDEWGEIEKLRELYRPLFDRLLVPLPERRPLLRRGRKAGQDRTLNVMEIGAGGGRSTQAVIDTLGERIGDYHVVDVSREFVEVLKERIKRPVQVHVVSDVDLTGLPDAHFDLVLAQSSWSHISLYDQYRYLRELRRVMKHGAPVIVIGMFLLGNGDDWTWNRFRRRVNQIERDMSGVYHEVTGTSALVEMLTRLEYDIEVVTSNAFVARARQRNPRADVGQLTTAMTYPYMSSLASFAKGDKPDVKSL
jgi:SAM-dependent methyltransferase